MGRNDYIETRFDDFEISKASSWSSRMINSVELSYTVLNLMWKAYTNLNSATSFDCLWQCYPRLTPRLSAVLVGGWSHNGSSCNRLLAVAPKT